MASPLHRHTRSGSTGISSMRKPQNTKAAAQRLAQVMAHQPADDEEEEDDLLYGYDSAVPTAGIGLAGGRHSRNRSPLVRNFAGPAAAFISCSPSLLRPSPAKPVEPPPPSRHPSIADRSSQPIDSAEEAQPPSARANDAGRSPSHVSSTEQPSSARFSLSLDFGTFKYKEPSGQQSSSALQDEASSELQLDMLQEENDSLLEKLRLAEERCEEAESRTRQLEKQIASLGEGVSLESRLLTRQEAELQKREAALKVAAETYGGSGDEIRPFEWKPRNILNVINMIFNKTAREEATSALDQLHDVEREVKSLRTMTQRMILTQEEMEEVVLKRCWLARCWSLCVRYGIHADIAGARHEYWSSLASRPVEVILAAGRKAKDENSASRGGNSHINGPKTCPSLVKSSLTGLADVFLEKSEKSRIGTRRCRGKTAVERGMMELRKLGVETKLWEESRRLIDPDSAQKTLLETEYNILA
ncbi:hypothetical protein DH2020_031783 [Rehmannia glutinosa]|uniref:Coiled-coil domain-containing protein SCD2 n=1 Tax=Rehmannia glutinosa TaxID=99300 RepID=A0ABR0VH49_REHGL